MADRSISAFTKHARRYGTEGILEAAVENGTDFATLVRLQEELDQIEDEQAMAKLRNPENFKKPRRRSAETRIKKLLGIEDEEAA